MWPYCDAMASDATGQSVMPLDFTNHPRFMKQKKRRKTQIKKRLIFRPKLTYPAARYLCDSWATCTRLSEISVCDSLQIELLQIEWGLAFYFTTCSVPVSYSEHRNDRMCDEERALNSVFTVRLRSTVLLSTFCLSVCLSNACIVTKRDNCLYIYEHYTIEQCFVQFLVAKFRGPEFRGSPRTNAVSYTHLTLPTIYSV